MLLSLSVLVSMRSMFHGAYEPLPSHCLIPVHRQNLPYLQEVRDLTNSYNPRHTDDSIPLHDRWREAFKAPSYSTLFQDPQEDVVKTSMTVTIDWCIAFFSTISFIAIQSQDEKKVIGAKVREILERGEGVDWVDKEKATFRIPMRTLAVPMRKK